MVFAEVQGKEGIIPQYEAFLNMDKDLNIPETIEISKAKEIYRAYLKNVDKEVEVLSYMEQLISQIRSREVVPTEIKLSIQSDYVYARSTFYRHNSTANDIRVIIGRTDIVNKTIDQMSNDHDFMTKATAVLRLAMTGEIEKTMDKIKSLLS
jgi:hypothetical protein